MGKICRYSYLNYLAFISSFDVPTYFVRIWPTHIANIFKYHATHFSLSKEKKFDHDKPKMIINHSKQKMRFLLVE